jgi:predicted nucleic acid-binding protein
LRYLLDTDVVSQATKEKPNPGVIRWLDEQDEDDLFLSVATLLEVRVGIHSRSTGKKREELERWLVHDLPRETLHKFCDSGLID